MEFVFQNLPNFEVTCSAFPVGTRKGFDLPGIRGFFTSAKRIRSLRPSVSLDFVGDFRERGFAQLIGSACHHHIGWESGHPHANLIRNPFGTGRPIVVVPKTVVNVYDAHDLMIRALLGEFGYRCATPGSTLRTTGALSSQEYRVGLHPFASQLCKVWPDENWRHLAEQLLAAGYTVRVFCAPNERRVLGRIFGTLVDRVVVISGSLPEFAEAVTRLDLLIGLDSFAVHLAHWARVPSITINAGTPERLWAVPSGCTLAASGGCEHYPCYNRAPCRGTTYENACVRAIGESEVRGAVEMMRSRSMTLSDENHVVT